MSDAHGPFNVAVVGGGIVGTACALALQRAGKRVVLIDRSGHNGGCAAGSAGVLATSFVLPLSNLATVVSAPAMLMRRSGPLAMRARHLPHYAGWLARFALNATPTRQRASIDGLKRLNGRAIESWRDLLGLAESARLLRASGMLDVVRVGRSTSGLRANAARLRAEGIRAEVLDPAQVAALEPALAGRTGGGIFHPDVGHVTHPHAVADALTTSFVASGGKLIRDEVAEIAPTLGSMRVRGTRAYVSADSVLVAAGWWSRQLLTPFGAKAPLRAERGYHVMAQMDGPPLSRPVSFHEESFLATPLDDGVRLAGTVELAPPDAPARWARADVLPRLARTYLPGLRHDSGTRWCGSRPSLPDSLPAIGALRSERRILYAFGHQHLGLTQAAITAELVRDIALRDCDSDNPFSVERFS